MSQLMELPITADYPAVTGSADRIRDCRRTPYEVNVYIRDLDGFGELVLRSQDVSERGVFVLSTVCFPVGTKLLCELPLPDGSWIQSLGSVVRIVLDTRDLDKSGMGIELTSLSPADRNRLERLSAQTFC